MQVQLNAGRREKETNVQARLKIQKEQRGFLRPPLEKLKAALWINLLLIAFSVTLPTQAQDPYLAPDYPKDAVVPLGATVTFGVSANSALPPLTYQWQHNNIDLPGATNWFVTLANLTTAHAGGYRAIVWNAGGNSNTSRLATLTVDTTFTKITSGPLVEDLQAICSAAPGDYDNDGKLDLLLVGNGTGTTNALYRNLGGDSFIRITNALSSSLSYSWGAQWADVDNDGDLDVQILHPGGYGTGNPARNEMFRNDGGGVFAPMNNAATLVSANWTDASWVDHDGDGWLDLFATTQTFSGGPLDDYFFRNLADGRFVAWTTNEVGAVLTPKTATVGPAWCDIDGDGDLDLYVSKITGGAATNFLYRNDNGRLVPVTAGSLPAKRATWAACWADFNNDGLFDLFTAGENGTNMLHLNRGNWVFEDVTVASGLVLTGNVYTATAGDFDNDGDEDLYVARYDSPDVLYVNRGDATFEPANLGSLLTDGVRNGAIWLDYNNDGFLDLLLPCGDNAPTRSHLYRNSLPQYGNTNRWLKVGLKGRVSNGSAIGARVWVRAIINGKETWQVRHITTGCLAAPPVDGMRVHFGLGDATNVDLVRIEWPSGNVQELLNLGPDEILALNEPVRINPVRPTASPGGSVTFTNVSSGVSYQWRFHDADLPGENGKTLSLVDLTAAQGGRYSVVVTLSNGTAQTNFTYLNIDTQFTKITTGPIVTDGGHAMSGAWGDYDEDGYMDLFVARGHYGGFGQNDLYHNNGDGTFAPVTDGTFGTDSIIFNTHGTWGDFDNDGHVDLFVGNCPGMPNEPYTNYLYRNLGAGVFEKLPTSQMFNGFPGSSPATWVDYNRDGLLDLFVCSSLSSWDNITYNTPNFLYTGHGNGTFTRMIDPPLGTDIADTWAAAWADYDNDGLLDLVIAAAPKKLQYHQEPDGSFTRVNSAITEQTGNSIGLAWGDYDNDGKLDLYVAQSTQVPELYRGLGNGQFERKTLLPSPGFSFMTGAWGDYDNDGYLDLFTTDDASVCQLFHNNQDGTFTRTVTGSLVTEPGNKFGCSWADYDNDGFLDLFAANSWEGEHNEFANFLFHNNGNSNHWLTVRLVGTTSNRSAIGARVKATARVWSKVITQMRDVGGHASYNENDPRPHFGLGDATRVTTLQIEWPSGIVQQLSNVPANQILTIVEPRRPALSVNLPGDGTVKGTLRADANKQYQIQASEDLVTWNNLTPVTTDAQGTGTWTDSVAGVPGRRFYKAYSIGN